jgi:ribosomal protein L37AE/L43A
MKVLRRIHRRVVCPDCGSKKQRVDKDGIERCGVCARPTTRAIERMETK